MEVGYSLDIEGMRWWGEERSEEAFWEGDGVGRRWPFPPEEGELQRQYGSAQMVCPSSGRNEAELVGGRTLWQPGWCQCPLGQPEISGYISVKWWAGIKTARCRPDPLLHKSVFLKIKILLEHCVSELSRKEYRAVIWFYWIAVQMEDRMSGSQDGWKDSWIDGWTYLLII